MTLSRYHWTECKQYLGCRRPSSVSLAGSEEPSSLPASPRGKPRGPLRIRLGFHKNAGACRNPSAAAAAAPLSGALSSLPPLGVVLRAANQDSNDCRWQSYTCFVPRSGKGGAVGSFELLPFNGRHPLSLAKLDSSPTGEPRHLYKRRNAHDHNADPASFGVSGLL